MAKDKDYIELIRKNRWLVLRREKLTRDPLCERCLENGDITPAVEVHHIVPVETATGFAAKESLMYDFANLRSLCHRCHIRTHIEMGRGNRATNRQRTVDRLKRFAAKFPTGSPKPTETDINFVPDENPRLTPPEGDFEPTPPGGVF